MVSVSLRVLRARRLSRYWNARSEGLSTDELDRLAASLDSDLTRTIDRLEAVYDAQPADPTFAQRLERELMRAIAVNQRNLAVLNPPLAAPGNGRFGLPTFPLPRPTLPSRARRWAGAQLATAIMLILVLVGTFYVFYDNRPANVPSGQETPTVPPATPDATPAEAWPMYRGDPGRTGSLPVHGPSGTPVELWRFQTQGRIDAAPAVAGGVLYVASEDGSLYALDAATGAEVWVFPLGAGSGSSVVVTDGLVYVGDNDGVLHAVEAATGEERWRADGLAGSDPGPVVEGVYYAAGTDGTIRAMEAASGEQLWSVPGGTVSAQFIWATNGSNGETLFHPVVVRLAPAGKVWVADASSRVFIFDPGGNLLEVWGTRGSGPGQFRFADGTYEAAGLTFAPDGSFFVVDSLNARVQHFDSDRNLIAEWGAQGSADGQFLLPVALLIEPDGDLLVSDYLRGDVQRFAPDGTFLERFDAAGTPGGPLLAPAGMAIDGTGRLYVVEADGNRVRAFDQDGNEAGTLGASGPDFGGLSYPFEVAIDESGYFYVVDQFNSRIAVFDPEGRFAFEWGEAGVGDGQFGGTLGVAVNRGRTVFVGDWHGGRLVKFQIVGSFPQPAATDQPPTATAASGTVAEYLWLTPQSGPGAVAPAGFVSVNPAGRLWVSNGETDQFIIYDADGAFVEAWGTAGNGDGTYTDYWMETGVPFRATLPDGRVSADRGRVTFEFIYGDSGTPGDPSEIGHKLRRFARCQAALWSGERRFGEPQAWSDGPLGGRGGRPPCPQGAPSTPATASGHPETPLDSRLATLTCDQSPSDDYFIDFVRIVDYAGPHPALFGEFDFCAEAVAAFTA